MMVVFRGNGQVSMEYLAIFSIATLLILPLIIIFVVQTQNIQADITDSQTQKIASKIMASAEEVYFMGEPAQKTLLVQFPAGIKSISMHNLENGSYINFTVYKGDEFYEIIYPHGKLAIFDMEGEIQPYEGTHKLTIIAQSNFVNISENS